jgi:WD repeat-containing protein 24
MRSFSPTSIGVSSAHSGNPGRSTSGLSIGGRPKTSASAFSRHVLSISASVTQVRWRPPSYDLIPVTDISEEGEVDRHDSMLVVATARLTSVGGSGVLSLWSFNRPYMALSVVEGHDLGAVADFVWLQTPTNDPKATSISAGVSSDPTMANSNSDLLRRRKKGGTMDDSMAGRRSNRVREADTIVEAGSDAIGVLPSSCIWQNLLSVGKDGRCIIQSLARGDRPIRSVPSSCFAMANLSPFQRGYGSLQCFSVYQDVPNHLEEDFMLTGLRQDEFTASAPGVFHEDAIQDSVMEENERSQDAGKRLPASVPELVFSVVDQGSLYENGLPVPQDDGTLCVAPEVVHLSRFARSYKLYPDAACATRVDLCIYNGEVAEELKCMPLARMWKTISSLLRSSGYKGLPSKPPSRPANAFQFAIFPTIRSLLLERAEAGDVQTCVVLCEVLQVIESGEKTRIPGLGMSLVREWYLSYIDLLHQMCLFSAASFLIKNCKDEMVGALNQQSTT